MLKHLQKFFNVAKEEVIEMVETPTEQAPTLAVHDTAEFSAMVAQLASQTEQLSAIQAQLAEAQALLAAVEDAKATLVADAKAAKLAARKESIVAAVGTSRADALMTATESLDEVQFTAVVSAMAMSFEAEAESPMFKESGVAAEAKPEIDPVAQLASKLAAQFN